MDKSAGSRAPDLIKKDETILWGKYEVAKYMIEAESNTAGTDKVCEFVSEEKCGTVVSYSTHSAVYIFPPIYTTINFFDISITKLTFLGRSFLLQRAFCEACRESWVSYNVLFSNVLHSKQHLWTVNNLH